MTFLNVISNPFPTYIIMSVVPSMGCGCPLNAATVTCLPAGKWVTCRPCALAQPCDTSVTIAPVSNMATPFVLVIPPGAQMATPKWGWPEPAVAPGAGCSLAKSWSRGTRTFYS